MDIDDWRDPLAALADISDHPTVSADDIISAYESQLPSVYDDVEFALDLRDRALQVLRGYTPIRTQDDTRDILQAFMDHLPLKGQQVLMKEIDACTEDPKQLRILRNFLVDAILKPSTYVFFLPI